MKNTSTKSKISIKKSPKNKFPAHKFPTKHPKFTEKQTKKIASLVVEHEIAPQIEDKNPVKPLSFEPYQTKENKPSRNDFATTIGLILFSLATIVVLALILLV